MRLLRFMAIPPILMVIVWASLWLVIEFGPLEFRLENAGLAWTVVGLAILLYSVGFFSGRAVAPSPRPLIGIAVIERTITLTALVGLIGAGFLIFDKFLLSGIDWSEGLVAQRMERALQVTEGVEIQRSVFLYISYLLSPGAYVAPVLFYLHAESVRRSVAWLAQVSVIGPISYALVFGGRSPIMILFALFAAAGLVRSLGGKPLMPRRHALTAKVLLLFVVFVGYVNYISEERRRFQDDDAYGSLLTQYAEIRVGPRPWVDAALDRDFISEDSAMNFMTNAFYLAHSFRTLENIIVAKRDVQPYWGLYEVFYLAPIVRLLFPGNEIEERMARELTDADIYGWFPTAWGAMALDFSIPGTVLGILIWGWATGLSYRVFRRDRDAAAALMLVFWLACIMLSFIGPPTGFSYSFLVLAGFLGANWLMRQLAVPESGRVEAGLRPLPPAPVRT
jgi:hypothetical protein